jgi:two-component system NtrC family sensor kinase
MILPGRMAAADGEGSTEDIERYRRVWLYAVSLTLIVSLTPLMVLTGANYLLFRNNLKAEIRYDILRDVTNISRSLEFTIEERIAALNLLVRESSMRELSSDEHLRQTFDNLKESFGGFVDLGLIDARGNQLSYAGPYNLQGANYADQDWFYELTLRGIHVSDVFLGFRQFPHFVIAVKREESPGDFYVLRATADMSLLTQHLSAAALGRDSDIFLLNQDGTMQTSSRLHGAILQACTVPVPAYASEVRVIEDYDQEGRNYTLGYKYLENTSFVLMTIKRHSDPAGEWLRTRTEQFTFLVGSSLLIMIVVLWSATVLVRQIRAADMRRAQTMHNAEYTNKMATIGRLAASVAHEINNPLAIINEKAGLLNDILAVGEDFPQREKIGDSVDSIIRSVGRCSAVTHRLLGFTRRMESREARISLAELLTEVLGFLGKETSHRNITVTTEFEEGVPLMLADRGKLQQVFLNIINNALAAIPEKGLLVLKLRALPSDRAEVTIADTGPGIPEESLPLIFEPYFSTKGEFGTGLGLSITYDLVKQMGGDIAVRSEVGRGTEFTVTLPLRTASSLE